MRLSLHTSAAAGFAVRTAGLLLVVALASAGGASRALAQRVTVTPDDPFAAYAAGATATFRVESARRGTLDWEVKHNLRTWEVLASGSVPHDSDVTEVDFSFDEPTYVTFTARIGGEAGFAGATFGRDDIAALADEPADFDTFWDAQKDLLAQVDLDAQVFVRERGAYSVTYQFSAAQLDGRRVHGYIVVPSGPGPFPATLRLPPYGEGPNLVQPDVTLAERTNCIAMSVNIHDAAPDQQDFDAYEPNDIDRREGIYYRYAILAAIRAIDYLGTYAAWNRRDLCIYGDSQGGGLAMLVAGIDGRPTHLIQSIAALNQHGGKRFGRPSGFPYYLERAEAEFSGDPAKVDEVFEATKYYDAVFAARRFAGPSLHFASYLDDICPPATPQAAHNAMRGPRVMLHSRELFHRSPPEFVDGRRDWLREQFAAARTPPFPFEDSTRGHYVSAGPDLAVPLDSAIALGPAFGYDGVDHTGDPAWPVRWDIVEAPDGDLGAAQLSDATAARPTVSFRDTGTYRLRLVATDPYPAEPSKFWTLTDERAFVVRAAPGVDTTSAGPSIGDTVVVSAGRGYVPADELRGGLRLFPNPARAVVRVEVDGGGGGGGGGTSLGWVTLRDALGRVVRRQRMGRGGPAAPMVADLDVRGLPRGVYAISVRADGGERGPTRLLTLVD